jgi:hypothetical protein
VRFESFAEAIDVSMALKLDRIWAGPGWPLGAAARVAKVAE